MGEMPNFNPLEEDGRRSGQDVLERYGYERNPYVGTGIDLLTGAVGDAGIGALAGATGLGLRALLRSPGLRVRRWGMLGGREPEEMLAKAVIRPSIAAQPVEELSRRAQTLTARQAVSDEEKLRRMMLMRDRVESGLSPSEGLPIPTQDLEDLRSWIAQGAARGGKGVAAADAKYAKKFGSLPEESLLSQVAREAGDRTGRVAWDKADEAALREVEAMQRLRTTPARSEPMDALVTLANSTQPRRGTMGEFMAARKPVEPITKALERIIRPGFVPDEVNPTGAAVLIREGLSNNPSRRWQRLLARMPQEVESGLPAVIREPRGVMPSGSAIERLLGLPEPGPRGATVSATIPSSGFVHGAPEHTMSRYLQHGIPLGPTDEGPDLGFVARLDHPSGYQGSMTAIGGFGPRTKFSSSLESTTGIGREKIRDSVAYLLDNAIPAYPRRAEEFVSEFPFNYDDARTIIPRDVRLAEQRARRHDLLKAMSEKGLDRLSPSHRVDHEAIVSREVADQVARPEQIIGIVYDGPLTTAWRSMKEAGRRVPIYDSQGALRLGTEHAGKRTRGFNMVGGSPVSSAARNNLERGMIGTPGPLTVEKLLAEAPQSQYAFAPSTVGKPLGNTVMERMAANRSAADAADLGRSLQPYRTVADFNKLFQPNIDTLLRPRAKPAISGQGLMALLAATGAGLGGVATMLARKPPESEDELDAYIPDPVSSPSEPSPQSQLLNRPTRWYTDY